MNGMNRESFSIGKKEYRVGDKVGDWEITKIELVFGTGQHGEPSQYVTFKKDGKEKRVYVDLYYVTQNDIIRSLSAAYGGKRSRKTHKRRTHKRKTHKRRTHRRRN
jgi:hypothetical protein